jgi:outer membrane protein TolC
MPCVSKASRVAAAGIVVWSLGLRTAYAQPNVAPPEPQPAAPVAQNGTPLSLAEALRTTLRSHPVLKGAQAGISLAKARVGIAGSIYDPIVRSSLSHLHTIAPALGPLGVARPQDYAVVGDVTSLTASASALSPWGTVVTPSAGLSRLHNRADIDLPNQPAAANTALMNLAVIQPLLRGAGRTAVASGIDSAEATRRASEHELALTAQQLTFATAAEYFELVAARATVVLLQEGEALAKKLVDDTRLLVQANQRPAADLRQIEGNLANRSRAVLLAKNDEIQSSYRLRAAMGIGFEGQAPWVGTDALPAGREAPEDRESAVRRAREARPDLKAARENVEAAAALFRGAERNALPALDVTASVGYGGGNERSGIGPFFTSPANNIPGVSAGVGLRLELPVRNTLRESELAARRAELELARVALADLERLVPINVHAAFEDLSLSAQSLAAAAKTTESYQLSVESAQEKLKAGIGTIIDTITTQEYLIQSKQALVQNQLRYSQALARVLLETSQLPIDDAGVPDAVRLLLNQGQSRAGQ